MTQNNMINFVTLTDLDADKVELNPAFIVMMKRDTYDQEEGIQMPMTKIYLSSGHQIYAMETPEQIAQLQLDAATSLMKTFVQMTTDMFEEEFEEDI